MEFKSLKKVVAIGALSLAIAGISTSVNAAPVSDNQVDFDNDNKTDYAVYRALDGSLGQSVWYISSSALGNNTLTYQWGLLGDIPVPGNFYSTSGSDIAVYRPSTGTWYIRKYNAGLTFNEAAPAFQWGLPDDKPFACDFDGDAKDDITVYRPSNGVWYVRKSTGSFETAQVQQWGGIAGDVAVPHDFDNDNKCDFTVFRGGQWFVSLSSDNNTTAGVVPWGAAGDAPVPGDYDSDTITDFAVYRSGNWFIRKSTLAGLTSRTISWGLAGDVPVPADYTGDGKTDIAVWRPSTGIFYVLTSESNYATATAQQFGLNGDVPVGSRPVNAN